MIVDISSPFNTYMNMVTAVAVTVGLVTGYLRDQRLARNNEKVATAVAGVAVKAEKVADAVVGVKTELNVSKEEVAVHREDEKQAFGTLNNKLDATHRIVNAQKTAMMRKVADAQLVALTMAQGMLEVLPNSEKIRTAVATAQALYDQSMKDLEVKEQEA